jgi:twitching motility protein PilT
MQISELLTLAVYKGASDLHLSAGMQAMLRLDGDMVPTGLAELNDSTLRRMLAEIMSEAGQREFEQRLECDFSLELADKGRFRVNVFTQSRGIAAVFRTIPARVLPLAELGNASVLQKIASFPRGLVLVTGPTGSGKSTTLAAMIDHINSTSAAHILTIEDPVEFVHESKRCLINQREVSRHTLGFNEALRSALREDPDIILLGELRDLDTIRLALTAAETGHLVFATLHTSSAAKTVNRIVDVFPAGEKSMVRSMLSESLQAVVSQTLLKKTGGGRVCAFEVMVATPAIRNLIREDKVAQMYSAMQSGSAHGMQTLDQHLRQLLQQGLISPEAAQSKAHTPELFVSAL